MKKLLAFFLLAVSAASAQSIVQGPPYIWRAQVIQLGNTTTLTIPQITSFPVQAFQAADFGTIDPGTGAQTVLGQQNPPPPTVAFDMLDADHASKTVTVTYNGVTYSNVPYGAIVSMFGAAVAQEEPVSAKSKAKP